MPFANIDTRSTGNKKATIVSPFPENGRASSRALRNSPRRLRVIHFRHSFVRKQERRDPQLLYGPTRVTARSTLECALQDFHLISTRPLRCNP